MTERVWRIPYTAPDVPAEFLRAGYQPLLAAVLAARGIRDVDAAERFLHADLRALHDPMQMRGMDRAVQRVRRAIEQRERVAVFGDYDVDGITSTCLLTDYLRTQGLECTPYIPDRIHEGYGLNGEAVAQLHNQGVSLIITVDCGITAIEEARAARTLGVDMVVTDHHECSEQEVPDAVAVVDPKQPDCTYPNPGLAGVGVAFKLICALSGDAPEMLRQYGDLVAIGTVADVMPLTGENRFLVSYGLNLLQTAPRPGLRALLNECGALEKEITATTIGYVLAPRLNAAGRLGRTMLSAKLLMTKDPAEAERLAEELCDLNRERQALEQEIWEDASVRAQAAPPESPLVLASDSWHQGVIGIAASRLSETYYLPTIMIRFYGDRGKGSCRSFGGFNLYNALAACADLLEGFGGHALAAGLTIRRENIDRFRKALADYYRENPVEALPELQFDLRVVDPRMLSLADVAALAQLEPCGSANPKPQMVLVGVRLVNLIPIGAGKHMRLQIEHLGHRFDCIFFSCPAERLAVRRGDWIDLAFTPQVNHFRGRDSVQLLVTDVRRSDMLPVCRRVLAGEHANAWDAAPFCPEREDFVRVWRWLTGPADIPMTELAHSVPPGMHPLQVCLCMMIMEEMHLAVVSLDENDVLHIAPVEPSRKVDLNQSQRLKSLRAGQRRLLAELRRTENR